MGEQQRRYNEILFIIETCQANTLYTQFYSDNILALGCSELGENSYAHHHDTGVGISIIDRFTYYTLDFFERSMKSDSLITIRDWFNSLSPKTYGLTLELEQICFIVPWNRFRLLIS